MRHQGLKISTIVTGLLVITAGVLLFLFNTGVLDPTYKPIVFSWQMLLVALGFNGLFSRHGWFFSIVLLMLGGFFLLQKMDIPRMAFLTQNGWTILLVFIGLLILFHSIFKRNSFLCCSNKFVDKKKGWNYCKNESGYVEFNYVFSGTKEKLGMEIFRGGEINCVFGGIELDFYDCQLPEGVTHLELNTVFGGTVLYIPQEWNVEVRGDQVFGNFVDSRPHSGFEIDKNRTLIIKATSVFGGGEIKSKN